jgi:hypothetical protein
MSAKVSVQFRGIIQGEHIIADDVIRIGGDANCEICVPALSAHLLTLRFDGGRYTIFNRSGRELRLEASALESNGSMVWQHGEDLFLEENLVLTLLIDGNPSPVRSSASAPATSTANLEVDEPDVVATPVDDQSDGVPQRPQSQTLVQIMVIVVCLLGFGLLMLVDQSGQGSAQPRDEATVKREFAETITEIRAAIESNPSLAGDLESIRIAFQDARIHELRQGQEEKALKLYRKLLQDLSDQYRKTDQGEFRDDPVGRVAKLVYEFSVKESAKLVDMTRLGGG